MSQVPPRHVKLVERDVAKLRNAMHLANSACDDAAMDELMIKGVEVLCPVIASTLDVSASNVWEILAILELAPASSATHWLQGLGTLASASHHDRRLTEVLLAEADKISARSKMCKVMTAIRLAKLGVPSGVVDQIRGSDSSMPGMPITFIDKDGEDSMRLLEQVAKLLGTDFHRGILAPLIRERLAAWGLGESSANDIVGKVSDGRRVSQFRSEICRAFLCDRPTATDIDRFSMCLKLDTAEVFYRPILSQHLSCLGVDKDVARGLIDRMQDPAEVTRLERFLDQAAQRPFRAPPDLWDSMSLLPLVRWPSSPCSYVQASWRTMRSKSLHTLAHRRLPKFSRRS